MPSRRGKDATLLAIAHLRLAAAQFLLHVMLIEGLRPPHANTSLKEQLIDGSPLHLRVPVCVDGLWVLNVHIIRCVATLAPVGTWVAVRVTALVKCVPHPLLLVCTEILQLGRVLPEFLRELLASFRRCRLRRVHFAKESRSTSRTILAALATALHHSPLGGELRERVW